MYSTPHFITQPIGNNAFSYDERKKLGSSGEIYVPSLIQGTLNDLQQGSEICFEEILNGEKISCVGLQNFVQLDYHGKPIFIVDNHNHALSFRYDYVQSSRILRDNLLPSLLHIDQHSDMKSNENKIAPNENIEDFINTKTNVGNFIPAAINSGIIQDVIQVRTDTALHSILNSEFGILNFILDIDIDFREEKKITEKEIVTIQKLILEAELTTIATSPYFIDQKEAIHIIKKILGQV